MKIAFHTLLLLLLSGCATPQPAAVADLGTRAWMEQVDRAVDARDRDGWRPTLGSDAWMLAVNRKLGVYDAQGHGPDLCSEEWARAIHRKAFGSEPPATIRVVYVSAAGERLQATYNNSRQSVTLTRAGRTVTLPLTVSASGARYSADGDEVFWNKGEAVTWWKDGKVIFQGDEDTAPAEADAGQPGADGCR